MRKITRLGILLCCCAAQACASHFPIRDAEAAIAIAKDVCRGKAASDAQWYAELDKSGGAWIVDTSADICSKANKDLWVAEIPVNGPYPETCSPSLYLLICDLNKPD